ncbi:hypothetical protein BDV25DRAFT_139577 [Aspergillus avenaceus]|uniref:Protein kinase domain-containing protein n=1 Tax=Aspergillus avenaceus TaxID=36643 RepID=A0A5N6TWA7_ASPAV|nr:hypothetical protein BDV25DRAFT_139577 [Aspergillus avenaceus]
MNSINSKNLPNSPWGEGLVKLTTLELNLADSPRDSSEFQEIEELLAILLSSRIPGPKLLRTQLDSNEFSVAIGIGGQARVQGPSQSFIQKLERCEYYLEDTLLQSATYLKRCVVKQIHTKETRRTGFHQVGFALREVKLLCHPRLADSRVVKLQGWGLCLDSLERSFSTPRLPFLILERADYNLAAALRQERSQFNFNHLRSIAEDVGLGLSDIHKANICHGDLKLENILLFREQDKNC